MAIQSSGPLESAGMPVTNAGRASSGQNKTSSEVQGVVAMDEASCFRRNVRRLKQQSAASRGRVSGTR